MPLIRTRALSANRFWRRRRPRAPSSYHVRCLQLFGRRERGALLRRQPNADRPSMKGNVSELRTSPAPADAHPSRPVSSEPLLTPRVRCAAQPPEDDVEVRPEDQKATSTLLGG